MVHTLVKCVELFLPNCDEHCSCSALCRCQVPLSIFSTNTSDNPHHVSAERLRTAPGSNSQMGMFLPATSTGYKDRVRA